MLPEEELKPICDLAPIWLPYIGLLFGTVPCKVVSIQRLGQGAGILCFLLGVDGV